MLRQDANRRPDDRADERDIHLWVMTTVPLSDRGGARGPTGGCRAMKGARGPEGCDVLTRGQSRFSSEAIATKTALAQALEP